MATSPECQFKSSRDRSYVDGYKFTAVVNETHLHFSQHVVYLIIGNTWRLLLSVLFLCCDTMSLFDIACFVYSLQDASCYNCHCINGFFSALFVRCAFPRSMQYKVKDCGLPCHSALHPTHLHATHRQITSLIA